LASRVPCLRVGDRLAVEDAVTHGKGDVVEATGAEGGGDTADIFSAIDGAMEKVTDFRASLGAMQSRMNSTITSIDVSSENLSAAASRIRDVDYASETARLAQTKILTAASTSVLTQANQLPESVLTLLRG
jgi:flagellin